MEYLDNLFHNLEQAIIKDSDNNFIDKNEFTKIIINKTSKYYTNGRKIITVGNGGSAAIASHLTIDLLRNVKLHATCISDNAILTCFGNDCGYNNIYSEPMKLIADEGDMLVAISSSGMSENILNAVKVAKEKGCYVFTLSGFENDNSLFKLGDINLYIPAKHYGYVELSHQIILHMICDLLKVKNDYIV